MNNKKQSNIALLGAMAMISNEWEKQAFENYDNTETTYEGKNHSCPKKSQLTKKQTKARAKSKAARKARKR